jgi:hypothetical protein
MSFVWYKSLAPRGHDGKSTVAMQPSMIAATFRTTLSGAMTQQIHQLDKDTANLILSHFRWWDGHVNRNTVYLISLSLHGYLATSQWNSAIYGLT